MENNIVPTELQKAVSVKQINQIKESVNLTSETVITYSFENETYFMHFDSKIVFSAKSEKILRLSKDKIRRMGLGWGWSKPLQTDEEAGIIQAANNGENPFAYSIICSNPELNEVVPVKATPEQTAPKPEPKNFFSFEEMKNSFIYCLIGKLDGLMTWGLYHLGPYKGGSKLMATSDEILPSDHVWFRNNLPAYQTIK